MYPCADSPGKSLTVRVCSLHVSDHLTLEMEIKLNWHQVCLVINESVVSTLIHKCRNITKGKKDTVSTPSIVLYLSWQILHMSIPDIYEHSSPQFRFASDLDHVRETTKA